MLNNFRILIFGLCIFTCLQVSAENFRYGGYFQQYLVSDPQYITPTVTDWRRDSWVRGSSLNPTNTITGWGGARVSLRTFWGDPNKALYLELPLLFYTQVVNKGSSKLVMISNDFVMKTQSGPFSFSMSSRRVAHNAQWSFVSLKDPLGALKLPNSSAPLLTMKLVGNGLDWDLTGYYIADNRCNFVPRTEEIPDSVFAAMRKTEAEMRFFDEIPTYQLVRGTKTTNLGTWGFSLGSKEAVNISPRSVENENSLEYPSHGIGYIKQNVGLDFVGTIPILDGEFVAAAVKSGGNWYKYREHLNQAPEKLGTVSGDAVKFQINDLQMKGIEISSSYVMVQPGFQWTAVRDHRYAYVFGFLNPNKPQIYTDVTSRYGYGWRAMRDDDFLLRDLEEKDEYLSDVSTFLGLRSWNTILKYPCQISISEDRNYPALFSVEFQNMTNLSEGKKYYDPIRDEKIIKDYRQVKANLETLGEDTKLLFSIMERQYLDRDFLQKLTSGYSCSFIDSVFSVGIDISKRLRDDVELPEGIGYKLDTNLTGELGSGLTYVTSLDYRSGNYDYGLLESTEDCVVASPYTYWELNQYFEQNRTLNLGEIPIRGTIAAELTKRNSTLPEVSGTSLVAFGRGIAKVTSDLTATVTLINVSGPTFSQQKDKFPSNSLRDVVDCLFSYQLFGQRANTINFRFTRRYLDSGIKDNVLAEFVSRIGAHTLRFTLGRAPIGNRTSYIAGTKYDVRLNNFEKELLKRPWENWGTGGTLSDETFPYVVLNWSMPF